MLKVGTIIRDMRDAVPMQIVDAWEEDHTECYEAKWKHEDNTLSVGSVYIFGSQMENYLIVE